MSSSTLFFFIFFSFFSSLHCCFINHLQTLVFLIIPTRYVLGKIESAWYVVVFLIRSCQNLGREISPWYCRIQNDRPGLGLDLGDVVAAVVAVAAVELAVGPGNSKLHVSDSTFPEVFKSSILARKFIQGVPTSLKIVKNEKFVKVCLHSG